MGLPTELQLFFVGNGDVNIEYASDGNVKSVTTPLTLAHDYFFGVAGEQTHIGPDAFATAVLPTIDDHLDVSGILEFSVNLGEEVRCDLERFEGGKNRFAIGNLTRHK